ncbi:retrovirus-related pol polyprotein from transposon TNT 1-94 [Tanacetum coccineum]
MHNNIMAVGSRGHPPMLVTGRHAQWRSRFLRYIDTRPNGDALRKFILEGPYTPITVIIPVVPATDNSPAMKYTQLLMHAIERLQQGESLNIQDDKTNLFWEFGKFTSHDGESMESYYSQFYKLMNEMIRNNLTVATMQVNVQFLQQLQPEWSRFVTIVKQQHKLDEHSNPLALVAAAQPYQDSYCQAPKSYKSYAPTSKASLPTRSHATTKNKGKEIAKPITPPSESASEEDSDPEQAQKDKEMQKNLALIAKYFKKLYKPTNNNLRTSSNTRNKNVDTTPRYKNDNQTGQFGNQRTMTVAGARETVGSQVVQQSGIQCFNCKEFGHFAKECRKPKRVKDSTYHKEKMLLCKQAEKGVPLQAEQSDWLADTDEEIDEQELEAHYSYMAKIQEVPNADSGTDSEPLEQVQYDTGYNVFANEIQHSEQSESISNTCVVETGDSNVIPDSPNMCDNDIQNDQNDVECDDERVALANLIANLKLDVDENKKIQKQLKKANTTLAHELTECKSILAETSRTLEESNSIRDSCLVALQNKQTELEKYMAFNDRTVDYGKLEHKLNETLGLLAQKDIDIKEGLKLKAYEISIVQEKHDELVKQSLLTKSHYEGLVKEKTKRVLSKPVTTQNLPQTARKVVSNTNVIKPGMYRIDTRTTQTRALQLPQTYKNTNPCISTSTGVTHRISVSRPTPRSTQMKDKVVPNTSQVKFKKTEIEDYHRISSISNKIKSVTACNDSSKSRTSNVIDYTTVPSQQELDLLFGPLYNEFCNAGTSRVNKSSSPTDNSNQQDTLPTTNIHPTLDPSTPTNVYAKENNDIQAENT